MEVQKPSKDHNFHYDLFVIGGGSGGLAASRAAASYGAKVGLADFVKPSPAGTKWGLGGTCVNVGCIPKKLFHHISQMGQFRSDMNEAGWTVDHQVKHKWQVASQKIGDYIRGLNFGYKKSLNNQNVKYYNKYAKLISKNQIQLTDAKGVTQVVSAKYILIATGGRPTAPGIPGQQHSISSDDIFWKQQNPGKTLVVGASYIALQCGGFLHGLGCDVTIMVRSIFLRGFDQHMANKVGNYMQKSGIKFIKGAVPVKIELNQQGRKVVTFKQGQQELSDVYDTVLFAIGRSAETKRIGLQEVGVKVAENGKILASDDDKTSVENIYAIGDVCHGRLELTPTAIMAGRLLAARLFNEKTTLMSYKYVPTTVFTPLEYGCCGYSQEQARKVFGTQNIVAYGSVFKPLQWSLNYEREDDCYAKLVTHQGEGGKVLGFHYLGPHAGQVTQGFAALMLKGATKQDFDRTVGIHPTCAEQFTTLKAIAGSAAQKKEGC